MWFVYLRGKVWWSNVNGLRRSTKQRDEKAAQAVARDRERCAADPSYAASQTVTVNDAVQHMLADLRRRGRAPATLGFNEEKSGHLVRVFGHHSPLSVITAKSVDAYIAGREEDGAKPLTISHEVGVLRKTLKVAFRRGEFAVDPARVLPIGYSPKYKPRERWLTPEELQKLMTQLAARKTTADNEHYPLRRAAHVAFIVATSANLSESIRAERGDVAKDLSVVHVRGTKREARDRRVPITPLTRHLLEFALKHAPGDGVLFDRWHKMHRDIHEACDRAKIARCSPNDLRRTHSKWLRNAGVEPHLIASVLGHTTSDMVEKVYGRIDTGALRARLMERIQTVPSLYEVGGKREPERQPMRSRTGEKQAPPARIERATNGLGNRCLDSKKRKHNEEIEELFVPIVRMVYEAPELRKLGQLSTEALEAMLALAALPPLKEGRR